MACLVVIRATTDARSVDQGRSPAASASRFYKAGEQVFPAAWARDGSLLVTVVENGIPSIRLLNAAGVVQANVRGPNANSWASDVHPLNRAMLVEAYENGVSDLYRIELASGAISRITTTPWSEWHPSWSPDGRSIVVDRDSGGRAPQLAIIDARTRVVKRPTTGSRAEQGGKWSPNGKQLAFHRHMGMAGDTNYDVFVLDLQTGRETQITRDNADSSSPAWSPDGRRLAFSSNRDGAFDIYVACSDGRSIAKLTADSGDKKYPVWSPDGARIAYQVHGDGVWTSRVPDSTC